MEAWCRQIEDHYAAQWGVRGEPCALPAGPVHELPADFGVLCFTPRRGRSCWTFATRCMSQPGDGKPIELHMFAPLPLSGIVELLTVTAHYQRTGARLDLGHSVNFGRPWLEDSRCDRGLVSLPYLGGPGLELLTVAETTVRCLWLVPITASEAAYKQRHGLDALEERFERANVDYLDPRRLAVI